MRDITDNEVGGFAITKPDDLLLITDIVLVKQRVSCVSVCFDDEAVSGFFERQVDLGRKPEQFARVWCHSHPCDCPQPSHTDEKTFDRVFGGCDWSVLFILAQNDSCYARLRFKAGPGGAIQLPVRIDYDVEFQAPDFDAWKRQYKDNVFEEQLTFGPAGDKDQSKSVDSEPAVDGTDDFLSLDCDDLLDEIDKLGPAERELFMDELAVRNQFWNEESEVLYD